MASSYERARLSLAVMESRLNVSVHSITASLEEWDRVDAVAELAGRFRQTPELGLGEYAAALATAVLMLAEERKKHHG